MSFSRIKLGAEINLKEKKTLNRLLEKYVEVFIISEWIYVRNNKPEKDRKRRERERELERASEKTIMYAYTAKNKSDYNNFVVANACPNGMKKQHGMMRALVEIRKSMYREM